jgi:hydrogenase 3 maturation protease
MLIAGRLEEHFNGRPGAPVSTPAFRVFRGETAPENCSGEIKRFKPSRILIVDSADFGKAPGEIVLASPEEITGISFTTHRLPLFVFTDYLMAEFPCAIRILGIQPGTLELFHPVTGPVQRAVDILTDILVEAIARGLSLPAGAR